MYQYGLGNYSNMQSVGFQKKKKIETHNEHGPSLIIYSFYGD